MSGVLVHDDEHGVAFAMMPCWCCKQPFSFNPHRVPSHIHDGRREPICKRCMGLINGERRERGLEPFVILDGAYDPMRAEEL